MWSTCRKQWKLAYHDKLKPDESSIHLIFGTAIHEALQEWLVRLFSGDIKKTKLWDIEDFFKERLLTLFKEQIKTDDKGEKIFLTDKDTLKEFYADGRHILMYVLKRQKDLFPTKNFELVGCEIPLEMPINDKINFIGYIDIVIRNIKSNEVFIYDLKTSKAGWFHEKKDPKKLHQLLLYKRFYATQFDIDEDTIFVEFIILKRKINENSEWASAKARAVKFNPSQGKISVKKAITSFNEFVSETFTDDGTVLVENLQSTPSEKNCRWCVFRTKKDLCPEGINK